MNRLHFFSSSIYSLDSIPSIHSHLNDGIGPYQPSLSLNKILLHIFKDWEEVA